MLVVPLLDLRVEERGGAQINFEEDQLTFMTRYSNLVEILKPVEKLYNEMPLSSRCKKEAVSQRAKLCQGVSKCEEAYRELIRETPPSIASAEQQMMEKLRYKIDSLKWKYHPRDGELSLEGIQFQPENVRVWRREEVRNLELIYEQRHEALILILSSLERRWFQLENAGTHWRVIHDQERGEIINAINRCRGEFDALLRTLSPYREDKDEEMLDELDRQISLFCCDTSCWHCPIDCSRALFAYSMLAICVIGMLSIRYFVGPDPNNPRNDQVGW